MLLAKISFFGCPFDDIDINGDFNIICIYVNPILFKIHLKIVLIITSHLLEMKQSNDLKTNIDESIKWGQRKAGLDKKSGCAERTNLTYQKTFCSVNIKWSQVNWLAMTNSVAVENKSPFSGTEKQGETLQAVIQSQHNTPTSGLPKTIEARSIMGAFGENRSEDRVAVCETVPLIVPSCTWSELGNCLWPKWVVILDVISLLPSWIRVWIWQPCACSAPGHPLQWGWPCEGQAGKCGCTSMRGGEVYWWENFVMDKVEDLGNNKGEGMLSSMIEGCNVQNTTVAPWIETMCS